RNQWSSIIGEDAFRTTQASVDARWQVFSNDYFTAGLQILQDQAGTGVLKQNRGALNVGYLKQISGGKYRTDHQYLVAGLQAGFGQFSQNWGNYWFSNQYNPTTEYIDPSLSSGEFIENNTRVYQDITARVMSYMLF